MRHRRFFHARRRLYCAMVAVAAAMATVGPVASPAGAATTTIEDTSIGSGVNQISYAGNWSECRGCAPGTPNGSFRYSFAAGAVATIRFDGTQINIFGLKGVFEGIANISIDGGQPARVDTYAPNDSITSLYTSPQLTPGTHTLTITVLQQHNAASRGFNVVFERAEVTDEPPPGTIEDTAIGTDVNQVSYAGGWTRCSGCTPVTPNRSFHYSSSYGAKAAIRFDGTRIDVYGIKNQNGGQVTFSVDGGTPTVVDTFSITEAVTLLFSSTQFPVGTHTLQITNIHKRNAASLGYDVRFDRAVITTDPTPPPPPPPVQTAVTIEDGDIGTGINQVSYSGTWSDCVGCTPTTPDGTFRFSSTPEAAATIRFSGTQINIYGLKAPLGGFARIAVDGGQPTTIDTYAPDLTSTLLYGSDKLPAGSHTLTITNIHESSAASTWFIVGFDRAEVTSQTTPAPPLFAGPRSGKPWFSGTYPEPVMTPENMESFCDWRGTPCDFALLYVTRDTWSQVVQPTYLLDRFATWPGRLIIAVPPWPEKVGASNATCATGAYDEYWKAFGRTLNDYGRQNSFIRLAWEPNGNWYPWSGTNPTDYVNCWRHVADAINSTAEPDPTLCWCLNAHYSHNPPSHDARELYPGDEWADCVGLDAYDFWPASRTKAEFDAQANAVGGLNYWFDFARARNKIFGVGEWGVVSGAGANGGGDSPNYIQWMHDWFTEHAGKGLSHEYYFNTCEPNNVGSNLYRPLGPNCVFYNPNAGRRYQEFYRRT